MKNIFVGIIAFLFLTLSALAQQSLPSDVVFKIKREAFQNSQIDELAFYLTDFAGPRLAGSKLAERAEIWTKEKFEQMGLSNARIEYAADFPRGGWDNKKTYVAMTEP